jgi:hypothetical protein
VSREALVVGERQDRRRHPLERTLSARATAVRLRNASAVMPDDTCAKPLVGSDAGQPITKFAALNGVCCPTRISPASVSSSSVASIASSATASCRCSGAYALATDAATARSSTNTQPPFTPSDARAASARTAGSAASWRSSSASTASASADRRGDQYDGRIGAVLGFDQQVGGQQLRVGRVVGDHHALGGTEQHHRRHAVALHLDLRAGDRGRARTDDLAHTRERLGAEAERGDAGRPVGPEHLGDAELAAHRQHGRVDLALPAGHGRHDQRDLGHPGHHRGHAELVGDARVATPCRSARTARPT